MMKKVSILFIIALSLFAGKLNAQCVNAGSALTAICQNGTSAPLGGSIGGDATSGTWSTSDGGTFSPSATDLNATWTPPLNWTGTTTLVLTAHGGTCEGSTASKTLTVNANPTANAGSALADICRNTASAALGGSVGGSATGGTWSTSAGGTFTPNATTLNATWTPDLNWTGTATLVLTTSGGSCGTTTASKTINVLGPTANAGAALADMCKNSTTVGLGGSVGGTATGGTWSTAAGGTFTPNATTLNATWTPANNWTGTATLILTTSGGSCGTTAASKTVNVLADATANAGSALTDICKNGTSAALGGTVGGSATTGIWSCTDGGTFTPAATDLNATYTPPLNFTGTLTLVLTTTNGCGVGTDSKTLKVSGTVTADAGAAIGAICQGGTSAALGGSVSPGATGVWSSNDPGGTFSNNAGNKPDLATYTASAGASSPITLTLTASSACGTTTATKQITVNANPTVSAGGALSATCAGSSTGPLGGTFGGGATSAVWTASPNAGTFSGNSGSDPTNATFTPDGTSTSITLTLTTSGGSCGTVNASKSLTVNVQPVANSQAISVCEDSYGSGSKAGINLTLLNNTITGGAGSRTVTWYTDAGHTTPVATPTSVTVTNGKIYYPLVTNTVTLCTKGATVTYTVDPKPVAGAVAISGAITQGATVTASYTYTPLSCNSEVLASTQIWWYMADNNTGLNETWIATKAGTDKTYPLGAALAGKSIKIGVKVSDGSLPIAPEQFSAWYGPIIPNQAPYADNIVISGTLKEKRLLTATYSFHDAENDGEGASLYQWYRSSSPGGTPNSPIAGATSKIYMLTSSDVGQYINFEVTPVASAGTTTGVAVKGTWTAQITNDPPTVSSVTINGTTKVGNILSGEYTYSDNEGDVEGSSAYKWYRATNASGTGRTRIIGANTKYYQLTNADFNMYILFMVTPVAQTGSSPGLADSTSWTGPVTNPPPSASGLSVTGTKNVGDAVTGHYTYSDAEGDAEAVSHYQWYISSTPGSGYAAIPNDTLLAHIPLLSEQGKYLRFSVTPKAVTGTTTGTMQTYSGDFGPINRKPVATPTGILGSPFQVGTILTAQYSFTDLDGDLEGSSTFRWFRDGVVIPGATSVNYQLTAADAGFLIKFEVTPVSATGNPNTGDPVTYQYGTPVADPLGSKPLATGVCISGVRLAGNIVTGHYNYVYTPMTEGTSTFQWYLDGNPIPGANSKDYMVQYGDLSHKLTFEVTPKSGNIMPVTGLPVMSGTLARITMTKTNFSTGDRDTTLTAEPAGGYFWGTGVLNGKFSARSVDYTQSPFTVTYHYDTLNCSQDAVTNMYVSPTSATFIGLNPYYCQTGQKDTITVSNLSNNLSYAWVYYSDPGATYYLIDQKTIVIDPSTMRQSDGSDFLYFEVVDWDLWAWVTVSSNLLVDAIKPEHIDDIAEGSEWCSYDPKIKLHTAQLGGTFSGAVSGGEYFDPGTALGDTSVTYLYTSARGCKSSATVHVKINSAPNVNFNVADSCIKSSSSISHFINLTTPATDVIKYYWAITDAGFTQNDSIIMTADTIDRDKYYQYKTGGTHRIALSAVTNKGCVGYREKFIEFATRPVADFKWLHDCIHLNDSLQLIETTTSDAPVKSRVWFFDGDSINNTASFKYAHPVNPKDISVKYIVRTTFAGCSDTILRNISLRPTISLATKDYTEDFEGPNPAWRINETDTMKWWAIGTPDRTVINSAASGTKAWYTKLTPANQMVLNTSVVSPCFDFDTIKRPMIKIKLFTRFDKNRDGAVLQYKIGDDLIWNNVGSVEEGINWFNSTLIQGKPGGDQMIGWTAGGELDNVWGSAEHQLDELEGKKNVKFRISYGSNGTGLNNEGLAFDDIWIGRRTRGVLLEHFTNITSSEASDATEVMDTLVNNWPRDIINIQYHTNFPGTDPFYSDNVADVSARTLFYGISRVPYTYVDGGFNKDLHAPLFDYNSNPDTTAVTRRSLVTPQFKITLHTSISGGVLSLTGSVKALSNIDVTNLTLFLAVVQQKSTGPAGAGGETKYLNVFRKFIPDAGGIAMKRVWAANDKDTITEKTWLITKIPSAANIDVIAFLQNSITKEVYQAQADTINNIAVGIGNLPATEARFSLYPNPATTELTILFEKETGRETEIKIYNYSGTIVKTIKPGAGLSEYLIENLGLKNGIYLVRVSNGTTESGYKKLVVTGN